MLKRTIHLSSRTYVATKNEQLVFSIPDQDERSVPIEDIGLLEVDTLQATFTTASFVRLLENGATTVLCDATHHPVGLVVPLYGNTLHALRLRQQVDCPVPTRKRSWQAIIKAKISNQADVLLELGIDDKGLRRRVAKVLTDDSTNQEGVAAAAYWKLVLAPFATRRDPDGPFPNNLLNYGYAIVRACVARALVASGLHPALGLKHSNRGNAFALADDVIEPYRPFVDRLVLPLALELGDVPDLTPAIKKDLLSVLVVDSHWPEGRRPLLNSIQLSAASLAQTFAGERQVPHFPRLCE